MYSNQNQNNASATQKPLKFKFNIGTDEIREIVASLNKDPFNENFNLVSYDELNKTEMLELTNKIFAKLEKEQDVNLREENQLKTLQRFSEFLRILSYPGKFDQDTIELFNKGEKKVLSPIIYFCIANFQDLKKRAYLGKFLVPLVVPDEFLADNEMKQINTEYKELIEEFKQTHTDYEKVKQDASSPEELKAEITKFEQEIEQLKKRIKDYKKKTDGEPGFDKLFDSISRMRHEQEEETNLIDKFREQKRLRSICDDKYLQMQQKLIETKKAVGDETSAEEMLYNLKSELAKNTNLYENLQFEINEKRQKLEENENRLYEPMPSHEETVQMENKVVQLRTLIADLHSKLEVDRNDEKDSMMMLQKKQVASIAEQRQKAEEEMKRTEQEKNNIEAMLQNKIRDLEKIKGPGYSSKTEVTKYQEQFREKQNQKRKMEKELGEIKQENNVLRDTLKVLHETKIRTDEKIKEFEKVNNLPGISGMVKPIDIGNVGEEDQMEIIKGKDTSQLQQIAQRLHKEFQEKKEKIAPLVKKMKIFQKESSMIQEDYDREKAEFINATSSIKSELEEAKSAYQKIKNMVYSDDSSTTVLKNQMQIIDAFKEMLDDEILYQKGSKQLSTKHKSYKNWMQADLSKYEEQIQELKSKRDDIKENFDQNTKQISNLKIFEEFLEIKLRSKKRGEGGENLKGEEHRKGNMNVLVVN